MNCLKKIAFSFFASICIANFPAYAANQERPQPTPAQQEQLGRYPVFSEQIHIIAPNADGQIQTFLEANVGKTVFIDTAILKYAGSAVDLKDDMKDQYPPTDRFDNEVIRKCWVGNIDDSKVLVSGDEGFPLPKNQDDINAGCAYRVAFKFEDGDFSEKMKYFSGIDKFEVFVNGFFDVTKSETASGKTLYTLKENDTGADMLALYRVYKTVPKRLMRKLWVEPASGE